MFSNLNELLSIIKDLNSLTFIIPPGQEFYKPWEAILFTNYYAKGIPLE